MTARIKSFIQSVPDVVAVHAAAQEPPVFAHPPLLSFVVLPLPQTAPTQQTELVTDEEEDELFPAPTVALPSAPTVPA